MKQKLKYIIAASIVTLTPLVASAQIRNLRDLMRAFVQIFSRIVVVAGLFAFAAFCWGLAIFIFNTNDDKKREMGKQWMVWSIIGLFVMVTVWGILGFLLRSFNVTPIPLPPLGR